MRAKSSLAACVLPLCALLLACGLGCGGDFERQSQVKRVRVLAVRADPPELTAPATQAGPPPVWELTLTALVATPLPESSPPEAPPPVRFALCRAGNPYVEDFDCPGRDGLDLPEGRLSLLDPAVQAFARLQPEALGGQGDGAGSGAPVVVPFFIGYEADDGTGRPEGRERGVRRLSFRITDAPNRNPELVDLTRDGVSLREAPPLDGGVEVEIRPVLSADSRETYAAADGGTALEPIAYSWHATGDGELGYFRSLAPEPGDGQRDNSSTFYTPAQSDRRVTLHVVARDGRGGTSWISQEVEVR